MDATVVETASGRVQGRVYAGLFAFLGVPYGTSTVDGARFLPPQPSVPWAGTLVATRMGPRCPQPALPSTPLFRFSTAEESEDCLTVNVWTPEPSLTARLPVVVFLHGGAYSFGSANDPVCEGTNLARTEGVVVVTLNHRLNVFGFPCGIPGAAPNAGLLDIVLALHWVRKNIAAFGGEPSRVTLMGHSGGSGKVAALLAAPAARGLFQRAIMQSGPVLRFHTPEQATEVGTRLLSHLGVQKASLSQLQARTAQQLAAAAAATGLLLVQPVIDGDTLPGQPVDEWSMDVPLMIGATHDEATAMCLADPQWRTLSAEDLLARMTAMAGPEAAPLLLQEQTQLAPKDDPMHLWSGLLTRLNFHEPMLQIATQWAAAGRAPVYVYRVDRRSPLEGGILRSPHGMELPFLFRNLECSRDLVAAATTCLRYWMRRPVRLHRLCGERLNWMADRGCHLHWYGEMWRFSTPCRGK